MKQALLALPLATCALLALSATGQETPSFPASITAERGGFAPEGIEYDVKNQRFLLGSVSEGKVFVMDREGRLQALVEDEGLNAVIGIEVDEARNRLLAVSAEAGVFSGQSRGAASLGIYDLDSGERIALVDLSGLLAEDPELRFFPNDVAVDSEGNAYVTDSFAAVVYKVDTAHRASVFVRAEQFNDEESLNGIEAHADGYLLVAGPGTGVLYKVDLADPENTRLVDLPEAIRADGMVWDADGRLIAVGQGRTLALESSDNWASARIAALSPHREDQGMASTVAVVGDSFYRIYPHPGSPEPALIERVDFDRNAAD